MRTSSRTLIGFVVVAGMAIAIAVLFTRAREDVAPVVITVPSGVEPAVQTQPPHVLDQPPVVVREPEAPITAKETAPEPVVTRVEEYRVKDSANLGRVKLHSPNAEERAEMEAKLERFLKNQAETQRAKEPR